jgi:hypothetical protein
MLNVAIRPRMRCFVNIITTRTLCIGRTGLPQTENDLLHCTLIDIKKADLLLSEEGPPDLSADCGGLLPHAPLLHEHHSECFIHTAFADAIEINS